jgi:outer membrane protein TolC
MRSFFSVLLVWMIVGLSPVFAAPLSLDQFISRALVTHPWMKQSAEAYWSTVFRRESADAIYDWNLFASYTFQQGMASQGFTAFEPNTNVDIAQIELSRLFPGAVQLSVAGTYEGYRRMPAPFPGVQIQDIEVLDLSVSIKKPLWRNLMGVVDAYPLKLQSYQVQMAEIRYQDDLNSFVRQLTDVYLSWYLQYKTVEIMTAQMRTSEVLMRITLRQAQTQMAEALGVAQSRQQVVTRRLQAKQAMQLLAQQEALIRGYLDFPEGKLGTPVLPKLSFDMSEKEALEHVAHASNLAQLLDVNIETQKELLSYRNEINKPALDSFVSYTLGSRDEHGSLRPVDGKNTFSGGLTLSVPLEDTALVALDEAKALIRQAQYQKDVSLRSVTDQLQVSFAARKALGAQLVEADKLVTISREVARLEALKYQAGRSPSQFFVMGAQDRVLDAALQREILVVQRLQLQNALAAMTDRYRAYAVFSDRQERP